MTAPAPVGSDAALVPQVAGTHRLPAEFLTRALRVCVVGCGGTGSALVHGLPYLHQAMRAWGHPGGLEVTVRDGDLVSPINSVRQPFSQSEVGLHKAVVLVHRLNCFWGLDWTATPTMLGPEDRLDDDLVIGCVDTRAARRAIRAATGGASRAWYWLDCGNGAAHGQVILGEPANARRRPAPRLPTVAERYPDIVDGDALDDDQEPSCSAVEALTRQEPFVNQAIASHALALLARLVRYGVVDHAGVFCNLATGKAMAVPVPPEVAGAEGASPASRRRSGRRARVRSGP